MEMSQSYCTKIYKIVFTIMKNQILYNNYFFVPTQHMENVLHSHKNSKKYCSFFLFAAWGCSTEKSESQREKLTLKHPKKTKRVGLDIFEFGSFIIIPLTKTVFYALISSFVVDFCSFDYQIKQKRNFLGATLLPAEKAKNKKEKIQNEKRNCSK